jgi:hydrogenase maturation factor
MTGAGDDRRPAADTAERPGCDPAAPGGCAICGDEALPARVVSIDALARSASVRLLEGGSGGAVVRDTTGGAVLAAALDLVDGVGVGDVVLVHQGFVIGRVEVP